MDNKSVSVAIHRPTTRGELLRCLKNGVTCEVVSYVAEMTSTMLRGWLGFDGFVMHASRNDGWVIFKPVNKEDI